MKRFLRSSRDASSSPRLSCLSLCSNERWIMMMACVSAGSDNGTHSCSSLQSIQVSVDDLLNRIVCIQP